MQQKWLRKPAAAALLGCVMLTAGCSDNTDGGDVTVRNIYGDNEAVLTPEEAETVTELFSGAQWQDGTADCINNCVLEIDGAEIYYHASCGTFNDSANGRSLSLDDAAQAGVNSILAQYISLDEVV